MRLGFSQEPAHRDVCGAPSRHGRLVGARRCEKPGLMITPSARIPHRSTDNGLPLCLQSASTRADANSISSCCPWGNVTANPCASPDNVFGHWRVVVGFPCYFTRVSQPACLALRPYTTSKYCACSFSVNGPREPLPIMRPSNSRIGVTSAAVPVKKASSAI
jgi:hypothetical protein